MRKLSLLAHISLDGFVAGPKGELDGFPSGDDNLKFVCDLTEKADAALFGRKSYQLLNDFWPTAKDRPGITANEVAYSNWYNLATKLVVSDTIRQEDVTNNTLIIANDFPNEIEKLKKQSGKDILIFGSPSILPPLIQQQLIDNYWIFVNPVIFGKGIPLFREMPNRINFRLTATKQFANGEIALNYVPV